MSNITVFASQDSQPVSQMNTTHYIDLYDIHMDQKQ